MPVEGWAEGSLTAVQAIQDEIASWCRAREIEMIRLDVPEQIRLGNVLEMWGAK